MRVVTRRADGLRTLVNGGLGRCPGAGGLRGGAGRRSAGCSSASGRSRVLGTPATAGSRCGGPRATAGASRAPRAPAPADGRGGLGGGDDGERTALEPKRRDEQHGRGGEGASRE